MNSLIAREIVNSNSLQMAIQTVEVTYMINRTPPKNIREELRREVNFGCPVQGCGVPYLTWHHFDPPWREKEHHNPNGMIALCATHATHADGGRWTKDQIREMKQDPYISLGEISDTYGYLRRDVICDIGFIAFGFKTILEIDGEQVVGFERDKDGYNRMNILIRDSEGNPILIMENNDWIAYSNEFRDLRCSAQGKELEIISRDKQTHFHMRFDDYPLKKFKEIYLKRITMEYVENLIEHIGNTESVPVWTIRGKIKWRDAYLDIRNNEIEDLIYHRTIKNILVIGAGSGTVFSYESKPDTSILTQMQHTCAHEFIDETEERRGKDSPYLYLKCNKCGLVYIKDKQRVRARD